MSKGDHGDFGSMSMLDLFRLEAESHCATLNDHLLTLEQHPGAAEILEALMRASHSIKGAARIVNLEPAVRVAHAMEDLFVAAQQQKVVLGQPSIDLLLQGVDFLAGIAGVEESELPAWLAAKEEETAALVLRLTSLASQQEPVPAPVMPSREPAGAEVEPEKGAACDTVSAAEPEVPAEPPAPAPEPAESAEGKTEPEGPPAAAAPCRNSERALRVSAEGMNRLMGLAGEIQVESRWLPSFAEKMLLHKQRLDELLRLFDNTREGAGHSPAADAGDGSWTQFRARLEGEIAAVAGYLAEVDNRSRRTTDISHRLYREVIANRMRPFADGIGCFPRMVRDVARELGKEVQFEIVGQETMVDREILDKIEAPLNHLLRNALDHGVERPEEREAAGKSRKAKIRLEARHKAGMLNILLTDDGCGVDYDKLRNAIVAQKMVPPEMARSLNETELLDFLFLPNFTTKKSVSKLSGRGVGLDVVHSVMQEVRGVVRASSQTGQGTSFELQLPLTLSVLRVLLVEICNELYALPLVAIDHVVQIPEEQIRVVEGRQYFTFAEKRIGLVSARQLLEKEGEPETGGEPVVIMLSDRFNQYGLIVDRFIGIRDLVVQALDKRLKKIQNISAAAILEDGSPVLIADVEDMVRSMDNLISDNRIKGIGRWADQMNARTAKQVLVVDDSITVREVERKMLSAQGYLVDVAVDGIDAWNALQAEEYDLVVTDIDMPRMNGLELVRQLKADPRLRRLPVIIVSYKDREEDRLLGLEAGADYYLTKGSFHDQGLIRAVEELIGGPDV
ncbi:response regulator [Desulfurivibrio sp. D14AmB]|uniref:hybrid sensor histidine kinase/response regulator n=1 Tax=Desulfurivibrio sp. D14AmB TaxID=3374370 RepID=UPI00376F147A